MKVSSCSKNQLILIFGKPSNNICQNSLLTSFYFNQIADYFMCHTFGICSQHCFQILSTNCRNHYIFLFFLIFINLIKFLIIFSLLFVHFLHQFSSSDFHLNDSRFQSSPKRIVISSSNFISSPNWMMNKTFNFVFPFLFECRFLNRFYCLLKSRSVFYQDIIANNDHFQKF